MRPPRLVLAVRLLLVLLPGLGCAPGEPPLVIAHRGLPGAFPGNSLAGLTAAADQGADTLELDLWRTADGVLVVAHDGRLECFTPECSGALAELPAAQVTACLLPVAADGLPHPIPTVEAVLAQVASRYRHFFFELKLRGPGLEEAAREGVRLTQQAEIYGQVVWHSFDPAGLRAVRQAALAQGLPRPTLAVQLFLDGGLGLSAGCPPVDAPATEADLLAQDFDWILWGGAFLDRLDVAQARAAGKKVGTWGGDSPALVRRAVELGVDGIFTDHPALVRQLVGPAGEGP